MNAAKITLKTLIVVFIFGVIALLFARIFLEGYWPSSVKGFAITEELADDYSTNVDQMEVYTQDIRFPYDDNKNGNFFANAMYCVPADGHLQVALRYNTSALKRIAAFYQTDVPDGDPLSLFDFSLFVTYKIEGEEQPVHRRFVPTIEECYTDSLLMYRYVKLMFDDVVFEDATFMTVEIYLKGKEAGYTEENRFGFIAVMEKYVLGANAGENSPMYEYPLNPYVLSEEEKRRG